MEPKLAHFLILIGNALISVQRTMEKWTLEKIGELAGVSRATVSRVVNNHPNISNDVRERVQRIIKETGYQPNQAARSLVSSQSKVLGLVIPNLIQAVFTDPYYPRLTQGISAACNKLGYTLALFLFHTLEEERNAMQKFSSNSLIDGLIITADNIDMPFVPELLKRNMPFVYIGRPAEDDVTYIDVDNYAGGYNATVHMLKQGYERVAQIATAHNMAGSDRDRGYRQAMQDRGYTVDEELIAYGDFTEESGYEAMQALLPQRPDAVVVQSDAMALGASRAIRDAELSIPDDIALIGYDDLPPALLAEPLLTTIRQPIQRKGMIATETLVDMLQNPDQPTQHIILPTELIIRASCGAVS